MAYTCFWVQSDCVKPEAYSCRGCGQYPYGDSEVAAPSVPADFGQQLLGVHIGLAELLAKKLIAKPEELDEAIARNIERMASQDNMLREAVRGVDHVLDAMIRASEPGRLDLYIALDDEGEADKDAVAKKAAEAVESMVPSGIEIRVMVAPPKPPDEAAADTATKKSAPKTKPAPKPKPAKKPSATKKSPKAKG